MAACVISAFPGCGKSYFYNKYSVYNDKAHNELYTLKEKILDSDSSLFSWIYEDGVKTDKRNPDFPNNYIRHIKEHIDTEDFIFVSSHDAVRTAMRNAGIEYMLIYPNMDLKEEYIKRFITRGNDKSFVSFQEEHWDAFITQMMTDPTPFKITLKSGEYIEDVIELTNKKGI